MPSDMPQDRHNLDQLGRYLAGAKKAVHLTLKSEELGFSPEDFALCVDLVGEVLPSDVHTKVSLRQRSSAADSSSGSPLSFDVPCLFSSLTTATRQMFIPTLMHQTTPEQVGVRRVSHSVAR